MLGHRRLLSRSSCRARGRRDHPSRGPSGCRPGRAAAARDRHNRCMPPTPTTPRRRSRALPGRAGDERGPAWRRPRGRPGASLAVAAGAGLSALATAYARKVVTPDAERPDDVEVLAVGRRLRHAEGHAGDRGAGPLRAVARRRRRARPARAGDRSRRAGAHRDPPAWWASTAAGCSRGRPLEPVLLRRDARPPSAWRSRTSRCRPTSARCRRGSCRRRRACPRATPGPCSSMAAARPARSACGRCPCCIGWASRRSSSATATTWARRAPPAAATSSATPSGSDVEAALLVAAERGAADVVLFGWSMGGAIALQVVARSWLADRVRAVVLDAPVLDWRHVLDHHARLNRAPGRRRPARPERAAAPLGTPPARRRRAALARPARLGRRARPSCGCRC